MNEPKSAGPSDQFRIFVGGTVALVGLLGAYAVFRAASEQLGASKLTTESATQIVTLASAVMTLIGTIVGAFVGVQVGTQGLANAEAARAGAEKVALTLAQAAVVNGPAGRNSGPAPTTPPPTSGH